MSEWNPFRSKNKVWNQDTSMLLKISISEHDSEMQKPQNHYLFLKRHGHPFTQPETPLNPLKHCWNLSEAKPCMFAWFKSINMTYETHLKWNKLPLYYRSIEWFQFPSLWFIWYESHILPGNSFSTVTLQCFWTDTHSFSPTYADMWL